MSQIPTGTVRETVPQSAGNCQAGQRLNYTLLRDVRSICQNCGDRGPRVVDGLTPIRTQKGRTLTFQPSTITATLPEKGNLPSTQSNGSMVPSIVEIELTDPAAMQYIDNGPDLYARLQEAYPGDPGQLSGVRLQISDSGRFARLSAAFSAPQPGYEGAHIFGYLRADELAFLASRDREESCAFRLRELYSRETHSGFSGATISIIGGKCPQLRVNWGTHRMGVLRGEALAAFILCVRARCKESAVRP